MVVLSKCDLAGSWFNIQGILLLTVVEGYCFLKDVSYAFQQRCRPL
jgi:hypothetical protein